MNLQIKPYSEQLKHWPENGRHIMAQFDADTVVVYQAYRPAIGRFAVKNQRFGGEFSFSRMSWIKPNFLWMMFRSGWGTKEGQEVTLAIRLHRRGFDEILKEAVHSSFVPETYRSLENWRARLAASSVRLQWDPDHDPQGGKLERRALQLGLAGDALRKYAKDWVVEIQDVSDLVNEQRSHALAGDASNLSTPEEAVYPVLDQDVARRLEIEPLKLQ